MVGPHAKISRSLALGFLGFTLPKSRFQKKKNPELDLWASLRPVVRELKLRLFLSLGRQPEVECFLVLPLLDCFCSSSKAGYGIWLLTVIDVLASEWLKRKTSNFRLPFVVEHRLCLISLLMPYPFVLFVPLFWLKFFQNIFHKK